MPRTPTCHPERKHAGHGLCTSCYKASRRPPRSPTRVPTCHPDRKHAAHGLCKPCYRSSDYIANRLKVRIQCRAWSAANADKVKADAKAHRAANRDANAAYHRRRRYGLDPQAYAAILDAQGGHCAMCPAPAAHVDHDHATGAVRGLLCQPHNHLLRDAHDEPEELRRAIKYLENPPASRVPVSP